METDPDVGVKRVSKRRASDAPDTKYSVSRGDVLKSASESFMVEDVVGKGVYGTVTRCLKTDTGERVAVKMQKNRRHNYRLIKNEIATLKKLQTLDPDTCGIVRWMGHFKHSHHICLEFELLAITLRDLTRQAEDHKLPLMQIKDILKQVATALVHLDDLGIIHADLKPDNIMMSKQGQVKLIDFGISCSLSNVRPGAIIQTICYRSPEIMLGLPFTGVIDMWSLGCVAVELLTGRKMYPCYTEYDMWKCILLIHGEPPESMLDNGIRTNTCFTKTSLWKLKSPEEYMRIERFQWSLPSSAPFSSLDEIVQAGHVPGQQIPPSFIDLLRMLELDPDQRITPRELLEHPFINPESQNQPDSSCPVQQSPSVDHDDDDDDDDNDGEPVKHTAVEDLTVVAETHSVTARRTPTSV